MKRIGTILTALFIVVSLGAQSNQLTFESYASKSIYSFIRYINWPAQVTNQDFEIAVVGDYKVYDEVKKLLANRTNGNYKFNVTFYKKVDEYTAFHHIVFVDAFQSNKLDNLMAKLNNQNTLVITESAGATAKGSMINFVPHNGSIKFELSSSNINSQGMSVDSRLASLALNK